MERGSHEETGYREIEIQRDEGKKIYRKGVARKWRKKGKERRRNRKLEMERGREIKVQRDICKRDRK